MAAQASSGSAAFASPTPSTLPAARPSLPVPTEAAILEPSQGRPIILKAGEQFRFLMRLGVGAEGNIFVSLRHRRLASLSFPLTAVGEVTIFQQHLASMALQLPDAVPPGLYDLVLKGSQRTLTARNALRVVDDFKTRFRFIHLSDMSIDDPSAPAFDDRLVDEVNLLAPEFIVATGDYTAFARALNDASSWKRVLDYFARFDAPVFMACGDLDHEPSFSTQIAQSPVGTFDYGAYHGLLLLDNSAMDPAGRRAQLDFVRRDLDAHTDSVFNILVKHSDDLAFLDLLAPSESLAEYLASRKVRMLICGGSDDWDRLEHAERLQPLGGLLYIRTHQSSTALRGRATGVSHYRVIDVDGQRVSYIYPDDNGDPGIEHSIPVGRLRVFPEESSPSRAAVSIQNSLNQSFADARVWLTVSKAGQAQPAVAGGRLVQALDAGREWLCQIAVDLPDKGGVKVLLSADGTVPDPVPFEARYAGQTELTFEAAYTDAGLVYFKSADTATIVLKNPTDRPVRTYPLLRLNGSMLSFTAGTGETGPVTIPASGEVTLAVRLVLARMSEGDHQLQMTFLEDPVRRVTTFPVRLALK